MEDTAAESPAEEIVSGDAAPVESGEAPADGKAEEPSDPENKE